MKYIQSLDLLAGAMIQLRAGNQEKAARLFQRAAKHPSAASAIAAIDSTNQRAIKASKAKVRAGVAKKSTLQRIWAADLNPDLDTGIAGEDLREVVDNSEDLPVVQEGGFDEDEDFDDELASDEGEYEEDEEDDDAPVAESKRQQARFAKIMKNIQARAK